LYDGYNTYFMRISNPNLLALAFAGLLLAGCNNNKETKPTATGEKATTDTKPGTDVAASVTDLVAPQFADPELRQYFALYTAYLKKVVASIQNKDEAGTMKIFTEEGKQFNKINDMEQKAKAADEQVFTTWLMQTIPYQKIIVGSDYYKKWNEEYYKKVKEKFEKTN